MRGTQQSVTCLSNCCWDEELPLTLDNLRQFLQLTVDSKALTHIRTFTFVFKGLKEIKMNLRSLLLGFGLLLCEFLFLHKLLLRHWLSCFVEVPLSDHVGLDFLKRCFTLVPDPSIIAGSQQ